MVDTTGFHAGGGWFFKRLDEGRVEIRYDSGSIIFDKDTWVSIVASVSAEGDNAASFECAAALHEGRPERRAGGDDDA